MSAPLDHVAKGYDRVCDPGGKPHVVCQLWPECQCGEDCTDRLDAVLVRRMLTAFIAATIAIGAGLIFWGLRT